MSYVQKQKAMYIKKLIFLSLLTVISFSCSESKKGEILMIKAEILGVEKNNYPESIRNSIKVSIINNSDSVITICLMSCSWEDSWKTDNKNIDFCDHSCDSNAPVEIKLKPSEKVEYKGTIAGLISEAMNKFRIGFVMFNQNELRNIHNPEIKDIYINKKIFWSDSITLKTKN